MREFFKVKSIAETIALARGFGRVGTETVPLCGATGRVLAAEVAADMDVPGFDRSTMDGFATRAKSTYGASATNPAMLAVVGSVAMGEKPSMTVGPGEAVRIATGGMLPRGADAVVEVEHTEELDEDLIEVTKAVAPLASVVQRGEDVRKGEVLLRAGSRLRPQDLALAASVGRAGLCVYKTPVVGILSTGDEVVPVEALPEPGQVRDMNAHALFGQMVEAWAVPLLLGIVPDDEKALYEAMTDALGRCDVVLVSGGSSVGTRDHTVSAIERLDDSQILVHGVAISPGKPTILARSMGRQVWGLPGNVVSCMVVARALVGPAVAHLGGLVGEPSPGPSVLAKLARNVPSVMGRTDYIRVRLSTREDGHLAEPLFGKSGVIRTMVEGQGMVVASENAEGLEAGTLVRVQLF
ncbi:MAG: gephyrin-like molybdotransferase Glp [Desulfatibacillaceae bacterium]